MAPAMMPVFVRREQYEPRSLLIAGPLRTAFSSAWLRAIIIVNLDASAEGAVNSPLALLKSDSLNRRELTFKALAGLVGGAIGWLPVELASHNSHLGQAQTTGDLVAYYISAAIAAGAIGAFITAGGTSEGRWTPEVQRRFIRGFGICALLSLLSTFLGNFVFNAVLQAGGVGFSPNGELVS